MMMRRVAVVAAVAAAAELRAARGHVYRIPSPMCAWASRDAPSWSRSTCLRRPHVVASFSSSTKSSARRRAMWGYDSLLSLGAWETAQGLAIRHEGIVAQLNDSNSKLDPNTIIRLSKEMHQLNKAAGLVQDIRVARKEIAELRSLIAECAAKVSSNEGDVEGAREMHALAVTECDACVTRVLDLENRLIDHLLPNSQDNHRNAILEVRAGTGGEEAALFARDMFHMYERFATRHGWGFEVLEISDADQGGYKEASALITGEDVFGSMQYESGGHRVQRVPATEASGRVHTSAATVAVLPEAEEVDIQIHDRDLKIDVYRSGGKGGQHVNTTDSAVRITHLPTGTVVCMQDERSQIQNRAKAMRILRSRLYEAARQREIDRRASMRQEQAGSGERNERIRTVNYAQGRITDHRINVSKFSIDKMLAGEHLEEFWTELKHQAARDYPTGLASMRERIKREFQHQRALVDEDEILRAVHYGRYQAREMIAVIQLKKYRTVKHAYERAAEEDSTSSTSTSTSTSSTS